MQISETAQQLDQVRGVLYGMANTGELFLSPISSIAIHHALAARGRKTSVSPLMDQLLRLRDVQDLPPGHWLPVSTRAVILGECALLVSGKPCCFLQTDYGIQLFGEGLGRLTSRSCAGLLPREPLATWLNAPESTPRWAEDQIRSTRWSDPLGSESLYIFDHWSTRPRVRWTSPGAVAVPDGPAVGRASFATGQVDHYLLQYRRGRPAQLAELRSGDVAYRLRLALLALAGNPLRFGFQVDDDRARLTTYYLPADEMRLLEALGNVESRDDGVATTFPSAALDAVREVLSNLGSKEVEAR